MVTRFTLYSGWEENREKLELSQAGSKSLSQPLLTTKAWYVQAENRELWSQIQLLLTGKAEGNQLALGSVLFAHSTAGTGPYLHRSGTYGAQKER